MSRVISAPFEPRRRLLPVLAFLWLAAGCAAAQPQTVRRLVAKGVTYTQEITVGADPLVINVLEVDLKAPGVKVRCGQALDTISLQGPARGRETLPALAARGQAVAAVNADFFPYTGSPLGLAIRDSELLREPMDYRACLGLCPKGVMIDVLTSVGVLTLPDKSVLALHGINRLPADGETVVWTPSFQAGPKLSVPAVVTTLQEVNLPLRASRDCAGIADPATAYAAGQPLPSCAAGRALLVSAGRAAAELTARLRPGDRVQFRFDLVSNGPTPARGRFPSRAASLRGGGFQPCWSDVEQAVGGGPWLLRAGAVAIDGEAENMSPSEFVEKRHPRTAAGVTGDGKLLLLTVDGRQALSRGVSLPELAQILKRYGARSALNLDGGGSSTMVVQDAVVNAPSDGRARPIANGLLVYGEPVSRLELPALHLEPGGAEGLTLRAGSSVDLRAVLEGGQSPPEETPVLWGTADGLGFLSQQGRFTARRTGAGTLLACVGTRRISMPVRVDPGPPAPPRVSLTSVANCPPDRNLLTVVLRDIYGNPIPQQKVTVEVRKGALLGPLCTDAEGRTSAEVVWDTPPAQRVVVVSAGGAPVAVRVQASGKGTEKEKGRGKE